MFIQFVLLGGFLLSAAFVVERVTTYFLPRLADLMWGKR